MLKNSFLRDTLKHVLLSIKLPIKQLHGPVGRNPFRDFLGLSKSLHRPNMSSRREVKPQVVTPRV